MYSLEYMFVLTASVNHPGKNCATSVFTLAASAGVTSDSSRIAHKSLTVIFIGSISNMTSLSPLPQFAPFLTHTAGPHFLTLSTGLHEENKKTEMCSALLGYSYKVYHDEIYIHRKKLSDLFAFISVSSSADGLFSSTSKGTPSWVTVYKIDNQNITNF